MDAQRRLPSHPVRNRSEPAAPNRKLVNVAECPSSKWRSMSPPIAGQELALQPRDIHAHGTLGLAGAALQAKIKHFIDALIAESRFAQASCHGQAKHVGAAACGMRFLASR